MGVIPRIECHSAIGQTVEVKKMLHGLINRLEHDEGRASLRQVPSVASTPDAIERS
jgi:hypothetical protein